MRIYILAIFILLHTLFIGFGHTEDKISIIVHPLNNIDTLTKKELIALYMGKSSRFPNGTMALPLDRSSKTKVREDFYQVLIGKSIAQVNAYWARLLFTGRANPPRVVSDVADVLELVRNNRNAIGYIRSSLLDGTVKEVFSVY